MGKALCPLKLDKYEQEMLVRGVAFDIDETEQIAQCEEGCSGPLRTKILGLSIGRLTCSYETPVGVQHVVQTPTNT